ncbi:MAG TPA: hypothetical protein PK014_05770 [Thermoanaerobaculia bacterium]|nr:hypothetical protein [Thermoanaerobaculia bacterium]HUM29603.1 hypothetical protein [Thermoanaerobaculia bacterium]HXK67254.1 hypothetical protein [Thermoanaerobaculia bacterium]
MSAGGGSGLFQAVQAYKAASAGRLTEEQTRTILDLLKRLNYQLPQKNLLAASLDDLNIAGRELAESGVPAAQMALLKKETPFFFDVALDQGFIAVHPIRGTAKIHASKVVDAAVPATAVVADNAQRMAEWVGNLIEDGLQKGFLISPIAVPLAEVEEKAGLVDTIVSSLSGRWQALAEKNTWLMDALKLAIPIAIILLAIHGWFEGGNPIMARQREASATGTAVQNLKIIVNLMDTEIYDQESMERFRNISSFRDFEMVMDYPLNIKEDVFTLIKVVPEARALVMRHNPTNAIVILNGQYTLSLLKGRMRFNQ